MPLRDDHGEVTQLGARIAEAGEGCIFEVAGSQTLLAKIYKQAPTQTKIDKLRHQAQFAPKSVRDISAWPSRLLFDATSNLCVGFTMQRVNARPIHQLYRPKDRKAYFPRATWGFLVHVAKNLTAAFDTLHENGILMADVNEGNVFVTEAGLVRLIDCDSYQVKNPRGGVFKCEVGTPIWTPPELQGTPFANAPRRIEHDRFGLALLVFHLLFMGRHPYAGVPQNMAAMSDQWTLEWAIKNHQFAYSRTRSTGGFRPPPYSLPPESIPPELFALFEAAFAPTPHTRPTARVWHDMLDTVRGMKVCARNPAHEYYPHLNECPWCSLHIKDGGPDYFVASGMFVEGQVGTKESEQESERIWNQWRSVRPVEFGIASLSNYQLPNIAPTPVNIPQQRSSSGFGRWAYEQLKKIGLSHHGNTNPEYVRECERRRAVVVTTRAQAEKRIEVRNAIVKQYQQRFASQVVALQNLVLSEWQRIQSLPQERARRIEGRKRTAQLEEFLDRQLLIHANIAGIGEQRLQTLGAYGLETALDVRAGVAVPGFGPTLIGRLIAWVRQCESQFQFNSAAGLPSGEIARIDLELQQVHQVFRRRVTEALSALGSLGTETRMRLGRFEAEITETTRLLAQAIADCSVI
jgi:DNA-binding helix-hairpin-helix protein with protein kinase domain